MTGEPDFVSRQTHDARRFYLNLQPSEKHPLSLVCGGVERMNADYVVERSDFPYFAIEWVTEGRGLLGMGGKQYELAVGSLFAYGPGIPHRILNLAPGNMRKYYLDLAGAEAARQLKELGLLDGHPMAIGRPHEFIELWNLIDREARAITLMQSVKLWSASSCRRFGSGWFLRELASHRKLLKRLRRLAVLWKSDSWNSARSKRLRRRSDSRPSTSLGCSSDLEAPVPTVIFCVCV